MHSKFVQIIRNVHFTDANLRSAKDSQIGYRTIGLSVRKKEDSIQNL